MRACVCYFISYAIMVSLKGANKKKFSSVLDKHRVQIDEVIFSFFGESWSFRQLITSMWY